MFMYYTVCYFTGIFYAVVRYISMLFIDNKVLCVLQYMCTYVHALYCVLFTGIFCADVRQICVLFIDNKVLCILQYMRTYVRVLYCVLFDWYISCSHKANFHVIHRQ